VVSDLEANKEEEASPNSPADSSPVMRGGGANATKEEAGKEEEEELAVTNPKLASLIYHSFVSSIISIFHTRFISHYELLLDNC
jgi:hypothetical protein